MSIEFVLGVLFFIIIIAFIWGMVLLPQLFGISKAEQVTKENDKDVKKD